MAEQIARPKNIFGISEKKLPSTQKEESEKPIN